MKLRNLPRRQIPLIALLLAVLVFLAAFAPILPVPYDYPETGTPEWNSMNRQDVRTAVSPYHASRMTTWALLQTIGDYPFLIDISVYNTLAEGVNATLSYYSPLQELENRLYRDPVGTMVTMTAYIFWKEITTRGTEQYRHRLEYRFMIDIQSVFFAKLFGFENDSERIHQILVKYNELLPYTR